MSVTRSEERIERTFGDLLRGIWSGEGLEKLFEGGPQLMRVEEITDDGARVIRVEMPGIDPEKDVDISVADGMLHVRAERRERSEEEQTGGYRSEFRYGEFERVLRLPEGATESDITASYTDGILEIRVPTAEVEATPKRIPIQRG